MSLPVLAPGPQEDLLAGSALCVPSHPRGIFGAPTSPGQCRRPRLLPRHRAAWLAREHGLYLRRATPSVVTVSPNSSLGGLAGGERALVKARSIGVGLRYLKSGYPCCVRCIYDESYRDIQFFSIKYCCGGLLGQRCAFGEEVLAAIRARGMYADAGAQRTCSSFVTRAPHAPEARV